MQIFVSYEPTGTKLSFSLSADDINLLNQIERAKKDGVSIWVSSNITSLTLLMKYDFVKAINSNDTSYNYVLGWRGEAFIKAIEDGING